MNARGTSQREVVVVSGVRTAIGDYGGSLKDMPATRLGAIAIKQAVARAGIDPATVGHVVVGGVIAYSNALKRSMLGVPESVLADESEDPSEAGEGVS